MVTKSKSIKLFEKLRVLLISHWVLNTPPHIRDHVFGSPGGLI
jgi:hypothetical protein